MPLPAMRRDPTVCGGLEGEEVADLLEVPFVAAEDSKSNRMQRIALRVMIWFIRYVLIGIE